MRGGAWTRGDAHPNIRRMLWLFWACGTLACTGANPVFNLTPILGDGAAGRDGSGSGGSSGAAGSSGGSEGGGGDARAGSGEGGTAGVAGLGGLGGGGGDMAGLGGGGAGSGGGSPDSGPMDAKIPVPADGPSAGDDASVPVDATILDTGVPPRGSPPAMCGAGHADVSGIIAARGIAVDAAGTVYYTRESGNRAWIGRLLPGGTLEPAWLALDNGAQPRALRVDNRRALLYVAVPSFNSLQAVATSSVPPQVVIGRAGLAAASGLAVAADGGVFVSSSDGFVYRVHADIGQAPRVVTTTSPIFPAGQRPMGLAFGPSGHLFVGSSNGRIKRFRVQGTDLVDGADYSPFSGTANDVVVDVDGRLYIADATDTVARPLSIVSGDGTSVTTMGAPGFHSALAFGRGALDCLDLHVTDTLGPARRFGAQAVSLDLP